MATKRLGNDCYEKAGPDEPVFTLRAQDLTAGAFVRGWAKGQAWARKWRRFGLSEEEVLAELENRLDAAFCGITFERITEKEADALRTATDMGKHATRKWAD